MTEELPGVWDGKKKKKKLHVAAAFLPNIEIRFHFSAP